MVVRQFAARLKVLARLGIALVTACSSSADKQASDSASATAKADSTTRAAAPKDSAAMGGMAGMAMTGDPNRDFLRMMSDHHKGLIAMAHQTIENKEKLAVKDIARRLDTKQDQELEKMNTMLETDYKDAYAPKVMPDNQQMVDDLFEKKKKNF